MTGTNIKYVSHDQAQFFQVLKKRVNAYFKENQLSKKGDMKLLRKALIMLTIWLLPYLLIMTQTLPEPVMLLLCLVMGIGMTLVGANIMHEGCHGTFSSVPWINGWAAGTMYLLGGDILIWKTSHNFLHHSYTNIYGHDVDLEAGNGIIRFTDHADWRPKHRYQHVYAFFLYSLLTLTWVFLTDFVKMKRFRDKKILFRSTQGARHDWLKLMVCKLCAWSFWLLIPILVLDVEIWKIFLGFFVMHLTAGIALTLVFQLAHLTEIADMPLPDEKGNMENTWAIHQLHTTANWARKSRLLNWATGGLNHQIEHHLFPGISHVHYEDLSPIVEQTAKEFDLPYHEFKTFGEAMASHYGHLKALGMRPFPEP